MINKFIIPTKSNNKKYSLPDIIHIDLLAECSKDLQNQLKAKKKKARILQQTRKNSSFAQEKNSTPTSYFSHLETSYKLMNITVSII